ncbi:MAG: GFA family protein [Pseudomonadota bacterium]
MSSVQTSAGQVIRPGPPYEARCFCGAIHMMASEEPLSVSYCHCADCRRATGAPVVALAAFATSSVTYVGTPKTAKGSKLGATRTFCPDCGSSLAFYGDYVDGQTFIHLGLFDEFDYLVPTHHSYDGERPNWLNIDDQCARFPGTARQALNAAAAAQGG